MKMEKLTKLEMTTMGMTIQGFMHGQRNFMKKGSEDDISDIAERLSLAADRFLNGTPTLKDLCIAKVSCTLPYTHFEAQFEKKLWKAQIIAWKKLHAFDVHGRTIIGIRFLRNIIIEDDETFFKQYLEFEFLPSYEDVIDKASSQYYTRLALMMRRES